ncbi:MAG: putative baseplate assembly protein [Herpetosiphonaceae bacterium]|nr:putative baseplate assembly protein [Herpetosiphonaceae bacterium]
MPLPTPNLDDRRFQDLVDEAKRMIPRYTPEWTDHNVSDPGVMLIELFAWMVEMMLFRVNRVTDKSLITFMELMGVQLQPAAPARADLTFWLSAPPIGPVLIPLNTQVTTANIGTDSEVAFSTDADLVVIPPELVACFTSPNERVFDDQRWRLAAENESFMAFSPRPRPGDAFYLGFEDNLSGLILSLRIDCSLQGIGVDPTNPPIIWEAWCDEQWVELGGAALERDGTGGLNQRGEVVLYLPATMTTIEINGTTAYWLRCQYITPEPGQSAYLASPLISDLQAATLGGTVSATHCRTINATQLGHSDGMPGQRFFLEYPPILPRSTGQHVEVQTADDTWEPWSETEHFSGSRPADRHVVLDSVTGEVAFGPAIREPDGTERQYGAIPARGSALRFTSYNSGGGSIGNVGRGTLKLLRHTVPYVDRVVNRFAATGGRDTETIEHAAFRAPQTLRTRFRAVTAEDYQFLALEASAGIARAHCLQPRSADDPEGLAPGTLQVLLIPSISDSTEPPTLDQLRLPPRLTQIVREYLDARRLLTTTVLLSEPEYTAVGVDVQLKTQFRAKDDTIIRETLARLYRFLHPLVGGRDGQGWPFGKALYPSEVYAILQGIPGVDYIQQVKLFQTIDGARTAQEAVLLTERGMILSAEHRVSVVEEQ